MIKAVIRDRTGPVVLLGLSGENITRLLADEPILVNLAELGLPPLRIALTAGRTEADIMQHLEQQYGPLPFTCPRCTRTSHHPDDKRYGYCGACHAYTGAPIMKQTTAAEDLAAVRDQLREEISEARGTLKDLRHEIRAARELIASTRQSVTQLVHDDVKAILETEVTTQVALLGKTTHEAMRKSVEKVNKEFDQLADLLMGRESAADDREKRSIPELLQDPAILARAQHNAREAGRD